MWPGYFSVHRIIFTTGPATEESPSFATVVRRAAEILDLKLPTQEVLTEVLQVGQISSEPLLSFNQALTNTLLGTWAKPCSGPTVNCQIAYPHRPAPGDPDFLTQPPSLEIPGVQASASKINP